MRTTDATQPFRDWTILESPRRWERRMAAHLNEHAAKPSPDTFLAAAAAAMGVAMTLHVSGHTPEGLFIALWATPYLLIGACSKLVKVGNLHQDDRANVGGWLEAGSERRQRAGA